MDGGRITVPYREDLKSFFPDFRPEPDGQASVMHDPATTIVLRNMGFAVPSAALCHYDFPRPPLFEPTEAQKDTVALLTENMRAYVLSDLGTGKTACVLWSFDYLKRCKLVNRMLVVGPLSGLRRTWLKQVIELFGMRHVRAAVLHGTRKHRLAQLARTDVDIYLVNHDGVESIFDELLKRPDIDLLALDELAVYRNRGKGKGGRTHQMQTLQRRFKWVWGITGSPMPNAPTDVWNQCKVVTPWSVPKYWSHFRDELMIKVSPFKWVPKRDAIEKAYRVMQPAVRHTLDDVPEFASQRVDIEMGPEQKALYEHMRRHSIAFAQQGAINAVNGGALASKLLQISLGYVYTDKRGVVVLDNHERLAAMVEMVQASPGKVIVFTAFKHSLAGITQALVDADIETTLPVSGDMPAHERDLIFSDFQDTDRYKVLPAHPQCMSHSLTLTRASTILWFGPITSGEIYEQANGRIRRLGQSRRQLFAHFQSTAAERKLYDALTGKIVSQFNFLELFAEG